MLASLLDESNNMRSYFVAAAVMAFAFSVSQSASTADLPVQMPATPYVSPAYNWTAFYVGGNIGAAISSTSTSDPTGVNLHRLAL